MRLSRPEPRRTPENTIALINIVFLMLVFFLIAGTLTPPIDPEVRLVETSDAERAPPPDTLFVAADGSLRWRGATTTAGDFVATLAPEGEARPRIRLAADRDLPAATLIDIVGTLRAAGAGTVAIVTERGTR